MSSLDSPSKPLGTYPNFTVIPGPKRHWLKGNLGQFDTTKVHDFFYKTARAFNGLARVRFMHKNMLIIQDAETVQFILKNRPERFRRAKVMEVIFKEIGVHGVFSAERAQWKKQRILMNPAFKPSKIKDFYPTIEAITRRLCDKLNRSSKSVDIQNVFMSYTVDITSTLAFGIDVNTLDKSNTYLQDHLNVIFPMISYRLRAPLPYWRWFKLQRDKDLDAAVAEVRKHVHGFIQNARKKLQQENRKHIDQATNLLEAMILVIDENGEHFSEPELFANVIILLLAGEDTTANTLAWVVDYLADNAELQQDLFDEIQTNYPKEGDIGLDQLLDFPLLSGVLHEVMRLKPVAPHLYIEPINDEIIRGHKVKAGTTLVTLLSGEGFNETLFPECEKFDPYRWIGISDERKKTYAAKLMPFGYGARLCPGRQLSLVEMRLTLVELIRRFQFSRTEGTSKAEEVVKFTLQPVGLRVDLTER